MNLEQLSKEELIDLVKVLLVKVDELTKKVEDLEEEVRYLRSAKNSGNSSLPPSSDLNRPTKNRSLRRKTGRKSGGQSGHKGHYLEMSSSPDVIIKHQPDYCQACGLSLEGVEAQQVAGRQLIDIPIPKPICTEHLIYRKTCACSHTTQSSFPAELKGSLQYGANLQSMAAYFSVRQYLPYRRMKECFQDLFGLKVGEATLVKAVRQMADKSQPIYERIKANIHQSTVVGSDETGVKVNGEKQWFWTWQNANNTLISLDESRGFKAIEKVFPQGLPHSILVSDCWAAQLKTIAKNHQLCIAHLLRELNYFIQLYDDSWSKALRQLLLNAIKLKYEIEGKQQEIPEKNNLSQRLDQLLEFELEKQPPKVRPFHKRILKNRKYLLNFLYHKKLPADNNASERAIRNVKVKQKVSGQFLSTQSANAFVIIRSVIDTTIKNNQNVFQTLRLVAQINS